MFPSNPQRDELLKQKLADKFGPMVLGSQMEYDLLCIEVDPAGIRDLMMYLRDETALQYNFLTTLCGLHQPKNNRFGVVYHLHSFANNHRIRVKTYLGAENPSIDSVYMVWPTADWMERETYDFFGITFEGHPNLARILNMDEMQGFPLRKDFPLEDQTRQDKDDTFFGRQKPVFKASNGNKP